MLIQNIILFFKIILICFSDQATSPIQIEKNIFKTVANIEIETNKKCLLQSENNKYLQTSKEWLVIFFKKHYRC